MDTELARTFLEIVSTGSFQRAAEKLHISQTAVSARVRSLEQQLGRQLIVRNKAGAKLTPAGEKFLRYAPSLVQLWERAAHDVAVPAGHRAVIAIGAELSLWNPLLLHWMLWMRREAPDIALRLTVGMQESLNRQVAEGVLDLAIMYAPQHLPGLTIEQLLDEELVLVSTDGDKTTADGDGYVYVDWGPDFDIQHGLSFPDRATANMLVGLGPLGLGFILNVGGSGYFRRSSVRAHIAEGRLHVVKEAPRFPYPAYVVYATRAEQQLIGVGLQGLRHVAAAMSKD